MPKIKILIVLTATYISWFSLAFERVDIEISRITQEIATRNSEFNIHPVDPYNIKWVELKLEHMVSIDQYVRASLNIPHHKKFNDEETDYFLNFLSPKILKTDTDNTIDMKKLLRIYHWFNISDYGKKMDYQAWLLVQHADFDREFQKEVLEKLKELYYISETSPQNYAYLFDRVALSYVDPSQTKPQRYGTQGRCIGVGKWEPYEIEDPDNVDIRRAEVKLPPLKEYIDGFKDICFKADQ